MEFRKMVTITLYTRQQKRHWCTEPSFGLRGRGRGWGDLGDWHKVMLSYGKWFGDVGNWGRHKSLSLNDNSEAEQDFKSKKHPLFPLYEHWGALYGKPNYQFMAERCGWGCYSKGGAAIRPKADHMFSDTTCQHQKFFPQPDVIALVPEGPTKGSPPRLIQADGSGWLGPPLTLLPNGEALQWPIRSPESFCSYAVTAILEASFFFFPVKIHLNFFFYYKEFFSYWGLLYIVKAQITYQWWVLINTSSVIHTLITIHNVSLAYKVFSGHFPVSPPPPPTPELTAVLPFSWLILQTLEFHMNGAIRRVLFYIKLLSLSMLVFRLIHAVLYFASSFLSVVERKSIVWICHILFSHILTMDTCFMGYSE